MFPIVLALLLAWPACRPGGEQPSLSDEKVARIMADLYVAEAATNGLTGFPKDSMIHLYYNQVLEIHGVSTADYEKNLRILANDVPRMEKIVNKAEELVTVTPEKAKDVENGKY